MGIKEATHHFPLISRGRVHCNDRGSLPSSLDEDHVERFGAQEKRGDKTIL